MNVKSPLGGFRGLVLLLTFALSFSACDKGDDDNAGSYNNYPHLVVNGVTWAATNVDDYQTFAARPDMYTKFYQWNRAKAWPAEVTVADLPEIEITDATWSINPCPPGWRLPTKDEWQALCDAGSSWADVGSRGNAVAGSFIGYNHATAHLPVNMGGAIFMPSGAFDPISGELAKDVWHWHAWTASFFCADQAGYCGLFAHHHWRGVAHTDGPAYNTSFMNLRCVK